MGDISPTKVLSLSKQQLGVELDSSVPEFYKNELLLHMKELPEDVNFLVELEPGSGYGRVICLEDGCDAITIPLSPRAGVKDGGHNDGLGSLAPYRMHVYDHPSHALSRTTRIKREKRERDNSATHTPTSRVKQEQDTLNLLDPIMPVTKRPALSAPIKRVSSLVRLNENNSNNALVPSKKRASDAGPVIKREFGNSLSTASNSTGSLKRLKTEPSFEAPMSSEQIDETRMQIGEVALSMSNTQSAIDRINRKSARARTKADATRLARLTKTLEDLKKRKEKLNALLPSASRSPTKRLVKTPSIDFVDLTSPFPAVRVRGLDEIKSMTSPVKRPVTPASKVVKQEPEERKPFVTPVSVSRPVTPRIASGSSVPSTSARPSSANRIFPTISAMPKQNQLVKPKPEPEPEPAPLPYIAAKVPRAFPERNRSHSPDFDEDGDAMMIDYMREIYDGADPAFAQDILNRIGINAPPPAANAEDYDMNGDYHGRGRDTFEGPRAKADDIDRFLIEAGNAEAFDGNARVDQALVKLGLENQYELLDGMEVALMPHQTIGVAWMVDKEASSFKGGCLADDMGLGKTVQMIALMMKNRSEDPLRKTNLIIAPTALLDQWKLELEMKTNSDIKCLIYHGSSKPKKKSDLLKYDVVLTTYMTMSLEWPDAEAEMKKKKAAKRKKSGDDFIASDTEGEDEEKGKDKKPKQSKKKRGLLFQVDFYRIILDEAQSIRNRRTRASRAVTELSSTYRWCLTGTPIINSLSDAYGYIRFLKIRPWYDFKEFQGHIGVLEKKNPGLAVSRLQTVLNSFQLRRKKDTEMDGKRLIELPEKTIELIKLEFSTEEQDIYQMVETRTQEKFNRFLRAGTVLKNYHHVLVLLLRLRQICSHPCLIQEGGGRMAAFIAPDEVLETDTKGAEVSTELSRARRLVSAEFVTRLKEKFKEAMLARMRAEQESADAFVEDEECPICYDNFTDAIVTPCSHIFCRGCLLEHIHNAPPVDPTPGEITYKANERPCPICAGPVSKETLFARSAFEPTDEELTGKKPKVEAVKEDVIEIGDSSDEEEYKGKGKGKGKAVAVARPKRNVRRKVVELSDEDDDDDDSMSDFVVESDEDEEEKDARRALKRRTSNRRRKNVVLDSDDDLDDVEHEEIVFGRRKREPVSEEVLKTMPRFLPSTKMKYMMEKLNALFKEKPDEKVLIISQWVSCLSLVSDYLTEKGIVHVKYQGDMVRSQRDKAIRIFMSKDKAKVMLMSLKCGGVGLNLTRANNVISLDLGWSQAVEAQAFDRVHRLGQQRAVNVKRLVISGTVEDRVLGLQERKQTLADGSLGEGSGKKLGRLTVRELANLFGLDHRGRRLAVEG